MSNIIPCQQGKLSLQHLAQDPFALLFYSILEEKPVSSRNSRNEVLRTLLDAVGEIENAAENKKATDHWLKTVSGFGAALTAGGYVFLLPVVRELLIGVAFSSTVAAFYESWKMSQLLDPTIDTLRRHRLVLESEDISQWSIILEYAGDDLLLRALRSVTKNGLLYQESLKMRSGDSPIAAAISYIADYQGKSYESVMASLKTLKGCTTPIPQELPQASPIGQATRLNAVEVASASVDRSIVKPPSIPTGLSEIVADPYQSRAIFGSQRTGKSYLAACASKEISDSLGCQIFHMNLASFGEEDSYYWTHAVGSTQCDLSAMDGFRAAHVIQQAIDLVKRFYLTQNAILIVDEIAYLGSASNQHAELLKPLLTIVADKITTLSSSGKKRQQAIWTIAPEFVAGSLTQDAKAVKKLKLTYISIHPDKSLDWNGQAIGFDWELFRQIKANFEIADPTVVPNDDRICFVGSHWLPVGELPDLKKLSPTISNPVAHLEKSLEASQESSFDAWSDYPVHRHVLLYLDRNGAKTWQNIYDATRKTRDESIKVALGDIPGKDDKTRVAGVLRYLIGQGLIQRNSDETYQTIN